MNTLKEIILNNIITNEKKKFEDMNKLKTFFSNDSNMLKFLALKEKDFNNILEYSYISFYIDCWELILISKKKATRKKKGNNQGSIYFDNAKQCWAGQYTYNSKRKPPVRQRKGETKTEFVARFNEVLASISNGSYIEKSSETLYLILKRHIEQKHKDGITKGNSYSRDKDTLSQLKKCCSDFINKPIQKVSLEDLQIAKENMKEYAQSGIGKMWRLLKKAFAIASSPSKKLIIYNIMNDENLRKPTAKKKTKKIIPLTPAERIKFQHILNHEEKNHKYCNIVKIEWLTAMRVGEVLARSKEDVSENKTKLHIHNTLTKDENGKTILGEHTKTYNEKTGIDDGERDFPINCELEKIINSQISNKLTNMHQLLFWDYTNNTFISDKEVNAWLRRINQKYEICAGTLHNHRLRHDRISQWKEAGMDMKAIQYLAGHVEGSSITDDVYIDVSKEFAFEQYEKII